MLTPEARKAKTWSVIRVASGNFLEMYDFTVYGYYAAAIGKAFFPSGNEFASLMLSFMTFGVGFLMRPLGAIFLGAYTDHHGRRKGLMLTLSLMAVGIATIAFIPGYASIGVLAPLMVVFGRLLQGFSAGMEVGGVTVYLSEIATPGHKGFYASWQSGSQQVAVMFAAGVGVFLTGVMPPAQLEQWGWRVPLALGCGIIPFLFWLRKSLIESDEFTARKVHPSISQVMHMMIANWRIVITGMMLATMTSVPFYFISAYTPAFGRALKLSPMFSLTVTLCVGASNLFWIPFAGALSDRIGRKPLLIGTCVLMLLTSYGSLAWLASAPSFLRLLTVELWLSVLYGIYTGAMSVFITEIMPGQVRTTGYALAHSLAAGLFGGFTPAICTYLIHVTNNRAIPAVWLCMVAVFGLVATLVGKPYIEAKTAAAAAPPPSVVKV